MDDARLRLVSLMTCVSFCVLKAAPTGQHVRCNMVWHIKFPDYHERMAWINLPFVVQYAKNAADRMTLVPKE